ncbi:TetR/AcrR family transcriptional regulator [Leuconostoc suionicum]|uniref:TetR/AcrR family transcriptional regulator n=1 Tax=Leuconostoc suionicum TaxID=1511761 RepID=UPI0040361F71
MNNRMSLQTREWVRSAFLELLDEVEDIKSITISDISQRSGISRRTFYRYYASKEDILTEYIDILIEQYGDDLRSKKLANFKEFIVYFFNYWGQYDHELFILQKNGLFTYVLSEFNKKIPELYATISAPWHIQKEVNSREVVYTTRYGVGGLWNVYGEWLEFDREKIEITEIANILIQSFSSL